MQAVVFHEPGDIRLEEVPEPRLQDDFDAVVKLTRSAICGTDLHMVRGTLAGMAPGTILGHEGVGIVEAVDPKVRNVLSHVEPLESIIEAYEQFDERHDGWVKVEIIPGG